MAIPYSEEALASYKAMRRGEMYPAQDLDQMEQSLNRVQQKVEAKMREFNTGATRHTDEGKLDFEGFFSPIVLQRFAQYMHANRVQADGGLRASDNWQKGIPTDAYMKSLIRHVHNVWMQHRGFPNVEAEGLEDALCAVMFNAMGYLYELIKDGQVPELQEIQNGVYQPRWADSPEAHPVL